MITDVTRMSGEKVCLAALAVDKSIRLHEPAPRERWLHTIGGLAPGDVVKLDWRPAQRYRRPHAEDGDWSPSTLAKLATLSNDDLLKRLQALALRSVIDAFGRAWIFSGRGNPAFKPDRGSRSLATVPMRSVRMYQHGDGLRADFVDEKAEWKMVPLEDLALRGQRAVKRFECDEAILRVGLGRPFEANGKPPACYLQVNHIFPIATQ
jgi:hypothetical protein